MSRSRRFLPLVTGAAFAAACGAMATRPSPSIPPSAEATPAQTPLDRTRPPALGEPPAVNFPTLQRHRLSNGLEVVLLEHHELPVVDVQLVVRTGAAADAPVVAGRASLTADVLDEGTSTRNALELSDALDFLGATLETAASWDASYASLHVLAPRLAAGLELLADVALNAAFPAGELERIRKERLTQILQQRDEPRVLANQAFAAVVYGAEHPFGSPLLGTQASVTRLDRDALVRFYRTYYRPNNAFLVVVGDVTPATLIPQLERSLGSWQPASVPAVTLPPPPPANPTAIYLVDRPGAAQSEVRVGHVGVPRDTPDYFPLLVMNTVLGGSFTSRLNQKLREEKGYTYGAGSVFDFRRGPGPFRALAAVFTGVTDSALVLFLQEIGRIREQPVPEAELERATSFLVLGLPQRLETAGDLAHELSELALYDLGEDFFDRFVARVRAVTAEDVQRVARACLRPDRLAIVIAGDRAQIEGRLRALGVGPLQIHEVQ